MSWLYWYLELTVSCRKPSLPPVCVGQEQHSLVCVHPRTSPGEERSGEQSRILWAYVPKSGKDQSDYKISNRYVALPFVYAFSS